MPLPSKTVEWAQKIKRELFTLFDENNSIESLLKAFSVHEGENLEDILTPKIEDASSFLVSRKKILAAAIFYGLGHRYGFADALKSGNWVPWPDEASSMNCYVQSIANFAVAQECGLNPTLVEFVGFRQEGTTQVGGHGTIFADVGEPGSPEYWIIDQNHMMCGPITLEDNILEVENLAARKRRTHRNDFRTRRYSYILNMVSNEERIVEQILQLRMNPEAVLLQGQRIAIPLDDGWQSEEPLDSPWYIKFIPDQDGSSKGTIVSRIFLNRPGIKSRGLEYQMRLGFDSSISSEGIVGYFCSDMNWADFIDAVPMVRLDLKELPLVTELKDLKPEQRIQFELELMRQASNPESEYREFVLAARRSFERAMDDTEHGDLVFKMSAAEAMYQHEKGPRDSYLRPAERERALAKVKRLDPTFEYYLRVMKDIGHYVEARKRLEKKFIPTSAIIPLLTSDLQENPRTALFMQLHTEQEKLEHILARKPTYFDDAIDRLIFYQRRIAGNEGKVLELAKDIFGSAYESAIFSGYTRIFAEFLGHLSFAHHDLTLQEYKKSIVQKLTLKR